MRNLIAALILSISTSTQAGMFGEIGKTSFSREDLADGLWWQSAYPYTMDLDSTYLRGGVRGEIFSAYAFRLGSYKIDAMATFDADFATKQCPEKCREPLRFVTEGSIQGLGVSGHYRFKLDQARLRVEAGVNLNEQTFSLERSANQYQAKGSYRDKQRGIGYMYGLHLEYKNFSLSALTYESRATSVFDGAEKPAGIDKAKVLAVGYERSF